jgi:hypothetical protein|tara:strand:+ start:694 stop:885 length:192 start_codon:yes stop_codon:yes gene_type:complete
LEKERTNALEVAKKTYEERKAKASAKESLILVRFSNFFYNIVPKQVEYIPSILQKYLKYKVLQ